MKIPLSKPWITDEDVRAVEEVLKSSYLSLGPKLPEFEKELAKTANRRYAVAVNSGTSALHLIIRSLGIKEGDEVITTPFSFIASSNCVIFERAKPVFVDIKSDTYNMDSDLVESAITEKTKAIIGVDVFGQPADWKELAEIARKYDLALIEDSAESIGSEYNGKRAGSFGDAAVFAFYPNKQITTGEGGVVLTDNEEIAMLSRSMRNQGRGEGDSWLQHTRLGYNYRISDINCALGISQIRKLEEIIEKRNKAAAAYSERLMEIEEIMPPFISKNVTKMSWFVYVVRLSKKFSKEKRDRIIEEMEKRGVQTRNYFAPIHLQPFYRRKFGFGEGDFPVTEFVSERTIALPFYTEITEKEISYVVYALKESIRSVLS